MVKCIYIPKRYVFICLAHVGFFVVYALRVNLSVVLVAMVNATYAHVDSSKDPECPGSANVTSHSNSNGEFNWDQSQQGLLLSAFFYGYLVTQVPGGWLANRFGGKWVLATGLLFTSILTLLTPIAAKNNFYLLLAIRILEGCGEGVAYPSMHVMIAKWAPLSERSRMVVIAYSGACTGTIFSLPVSSVLANSTFLEGWPSAFYIFGVFGVIWFIAWTIFVTDSPETHSSINSCEITYIQDSQEITAAHTEKASVPWFRIFTSIRVWAIIIANFSDCWTWYLILTGLPSYFEQVLNFSLTENGLLSALPYIVAFISNISSGIMCDFLTKRGFTVTQVRRIVGIIAFYPGATCLILASYAGCDQIALSVACMVLAAAFGNFNMSGYNANHLDIAPRFAGVLMGITNMAGTISGCIAPLVTGYFTKDNPSREQYRKIFIIAAAISFVGGTFFNIFVSGQEQEWNNPDVNSKDVSIYSTEGTEDDDDSMVKRLIGPMESDGE